MARPAVDSKRIANSESKARMDLTRKGRFRKVAEPIATGNCDTSDGHARQSSLVCFSPVAQAQQIGYRRWALDPKATHRSEEHTSEIQSLLRISYAVFCLKKKINEQ